MLDRMGKEVGKITGEGEESKTIKGEETEEERPMVVTFYPGFLSLFCMSCL